MERKASLVVLVLLFTFSFGASSIQIISEPGVVVFLDGRYKDRTTTEMGGLIISEVAPGAHTLKAVKEGYTPQEEQIYVEPGEIYTHTLQPFTLNITISEKGNNGASGTGSLKIVSVPTAMNIRIPVLNFSFDKSKEEWVAGNIPCGEYDVVFVSGDKKLSAVISIHKDRLAHYDIDLDKGVIQDLNPYVSPEQWLSGIEMIRIPRTPGMRHDVYIGKYEVTQALFESVMNNNPSYFRGEDLPVEQISFNEAMVFCNKLSSLCGLDPVYIQIRPDADFTMNKQANGFRLPLEEEWINAAGGEKHRVLGNSWSGTIDRSKLKEFAWFASNSGKTTHPVGSKKPNDLGFHDMSGNVHELCWAETQELASTHILTKGGSWDSEHLYCRIDHILWFSDGYVYSDRGFRLARNAE